MARTRRRRKKQYKQVVTDTKSLGSSGGQILIGTLAPIANRNQLGRAFCKNITMTYMLQGDAAAGADQGAVTFYIGSNSAWADSDVITARSAAYGGGTLNIPVNAWVSGEVTDDAPGGKLYVWAECTDMTVVTNVDIRYTAEIWGSALLQYYTA